MQVMDQITLNVVFTGVIQLLYTVNLTRFRTQKIVLPLQGAHTEKHLPPGPFTGHFLRKADI